jgi:hypothetical protein
MYKQIMDRDPDPGGYNANVTYLPRADVKTLIRSQVLSPEYRNNFINGHSPDDVVMVLYKKLLGATVTPADPGVQRWVNVYHPDGSGFTVVVDGIMNSPQYNTSFGVNTVPHDPASQPIVYCPMIHVDYDPDILLPILVVVLLVVDILLRPGTRPVLQRAAASLMPRRSGGQ